MKLDMQLSNKIPQGGFFRNLEKNIFQVDFLSFRVLLDLTVIIILHSSSSRNNSFFLFFFSWNNSLKNNIAIFVVFKPIWSWPFVSYRSKYTASYQHLVQYCCVQDLSIGCRPKSKKVTMTHGTWQKFNWKFILIFVWIFSRFCINVCLLFLTKESRVHLFVYFFLSL